MAKFRRPTIRELHRILGDAAIAWDQSGQPESLRQYVLAYGAGHLRAVEDHERLWLLLRSDEYRRAQLDVFQQYEAAYHALGEGIGLYVERQGATPDDDPRLCWLALRVGELANEAKADIHVAFEWVRERPLEDVSRMEDALQRIRVLDEARFFMAALLLLWIEVDRQATLPEKERSDATARLVPEAVEERIPYRSRTIDWNSLVSPDRQNINPGWSADFMAWLMLHVLEFLPKLPAGSLFVRTSRMSDYAHAIARQIQALPMSDRGHKLRLPITMATQIADVEARSQLLSVLSQVDVIHHSTETLRIALTVAQELDPHDTSAALGTKSWSLSVVAQALARAGELELALETAHAIDNLKWRSEALSTVAETFADGDHVQQALDIAETIEDTESQSEAFLSVVLALIRAGDVQKALATAQRIIYDSHRSQALLWVSQALTRNWAAAGHFKSARPFTNTTTQYPGWPVPGWPVKDIADGLAKVRDPLRRGLYSDATLKSMLSIFRCGLLNVGRSAIAHLQALAKVGNRSDQAHVIEEAIRVSLTITESLEKGEALAAIIPAVVSFKDGPEQERLFRQLVDATAGVVGSYDRSTIALVLAHADEWQRARAVLEQEFRRVPFKESSIARSESFLSLVEELTRAAKPAEAENVARSIELSSYRCQALARTAKCMAQAGRHDEARAMFAEALKVTDEPLTISELSRISVALCDIAQELVQTDAVLNRDALLDQVFLALSRHGTLEAWENIATILIGANTLTNRDVLVGHALLMVGNVTFESTTAGALAQLGRVLVHLGAADRARDLFERAIAVAGAIREDRRRLEALTSVANALAQATLLDGRFRYIERVRDAVQSVEGDFIKVDYMKSRALADIVHFIAQAGEIREALRTANLIEARSHKSRALTVITQSLLQARELETAMEITSLIEDAFWQAQAIAAAARAQAHAGQIQRARLMFEQAVERAEAIEEGWRKSEALCQIAQECVQAERLQPARMIFEQALKVAGGITSSYPQSEVLCEIALALVRTNNTSLLNVWARSATLSAIVWQEVLRQCRRALIDGAPSRIQWLRESLCYYAFSSQTAYDGVRALYLAHLKNGSQDTLDAIVRHCPELRFQLQEN